MNTMHLFAGGGGGMYADLILGHNPTVAVEWEKAACDVLRARKEEWWPDCEIIEGDIRAFSGTQYAGKVDCIHAGVPCPNWSTARRGAGECINYWPETHRVIRSTRPAFVFLECVPGFADEYKTVRRDMEAIGYTCSRPLILSAADVGAPHLRERCWILCHSNNGWEPSAAIDDETQGMQANGASLWESNPGTLGVADGLAHKFKRITILGNGQVPLQAAYAWVMLGGPTNLTDTKGDER